MFLNMCPLKYTFFAGKGTYLHSQIVSMAPHKIMSSAVYQTGKKFCGTWLMLLIVI